MSSIKKTSSIVIVAIIITGIVFGITDQINSDDSDILEQIEFSAVYLKNDSVVQISFHDKSNETESVVLEILGMDVTYHKEYEFDNDSEFVENMYLKEIPKYGWKTTPVILEIQHSKFGTIGLKTEVYELGDLKPKIIVEQ